VNRCAGMGAGSSHDTPESRIMSRIGPGIEDEEGGKGLENSNFPVRRKKKEE